MFIFINISWICQPGSPFKSDLSRLTVAAGVQCLTVGFWNYIKRAFWVFEDEKMFSAFQNFFFLTLWCESMMRSRSFCKKLRKHQSIYKGVWDLGFLVTLPVVIQVTQKDSNNRHSLWKNKVFFMHGSLSNIPNERWS